MRPRSSSLFHFTKSIEVVKAILKKGFWPRYCLEDVRWQGYENFDYVAFPMTCFCDIPISRIDEHVGFYGSYGIGLTKAWGEKNSLNPIMYLSGSNPLHSTMQKIIYAMSGLPEERRSAALADIVYLLAYAKPVAGRMLIEGKPVEKEFYLESEWRFVPKSEKIFNSMMHEDFKDDKKREKSNAETSEHCRLQFLPSDVRYIFVPTDSEIPEIINFIQTKLDSYPAAELKVLMARVTSLESVCADA